MNIMIEIQFTPSLLTFFISTKYEETINLKFSASLLSLQGIFLNQKMFLKLEQDHIISHNIIHVSAYRIGFFISSKRIYYIIKVKETKFKRIEKSNKIDSETRTKESDEI